MSFRAYRSSIRLILKYSLIGNCVILRWGLLYNRGIDIYKYNYIDNYIDNYRAVYRAIYRDNYIVINYIGN